MTKLASLLALLVAVFVCALPAAPAQADRDRVFVASYGSDTNPCTFGSPCKTFQNAINVVTIGGEVTAIDSAGFGPIVISHAITITGPNGFEAGNVDTTSGASAIAINAGPNDNIVISGLTLDGDGTANTTGIAFNSGGSLHVHNCTIRNFAFYGINFVPNASSQLFVSNTLISNFSNADGTGINIAPSSGSVAAVINHVDILNVQGTALNAGANAGVTIRELDVFRQRRRREHDVGRHRRVLRQQCDRRQRHQCCRRHYSRTGSERASRSGRADGSDGSNWTSGTNRSDGSDRSNRRGGSNRSAGADRCHGPTGYGSLFLRLLCCDAA